MTDSRVIECLLDQLQALKVENARLRVGGDLEDSGTDASAQGNPIAAAIAGVALRIQKTKELHSIAAEVAARNSHARSLTLRFCLCGRFVWLQ